MLAPPIAMAKSMAITASFGGLLGASLSAFVAPGAPGSNAATALRGARVADTASGHGQTAAATAVATAAVALVAGSRRSRKTNASLVQMCAEEKFAGGLIGGESAT